MSELSGEGIILAGGTGNRLYPVTESISKHLLPVHDKPMIYYPLSCLMLAGIRKITIVVNPEHQAAYEELLGDGEGFGIEIKYFQQDNPLGPAEAIMSLSQRLLADRYLIFLGDNILFGDGLRQKLKNLLLQDDAQVFSYRVANPENYGVVEMDGEKILSLEEKPKRPKSYWVVPGIYRFDSKLKSHVCDIPISERNEYEMMDILKSYHASKSLKINPLGRAISWFDTGTFENIRRAGASIRNAEERTGLKIGCLEEIAFNHKWITAADLEKSINARPENSYTSYLKSILSTRLS